MRGVSASGIVSESVGHRRLVEGRRAALESYAMTKVAWPEEKTQRKSSNARTSYGFMSCGRMNGWGCLSVGHDGGRHAPKK